MLKINQKNQIDHEPLDSRFSDESQESKYIYSDSSEPSITVSKGVGAIETCNFIKKDGKQCNVLPLHGEDKCFFHSTDPEVVANRAEAAKKGGENGRKQMLVPSQEELSLVSLSDLAVLVGRTINDVRQNRVTTSQANCIWYLAGTLAKIYEIRDVLSNVV